jgi:hypothetical protein
MLTAAMVLTDYFFRWDDKFHVSIIRNFENKRAYHPMGKRWGHQQLSFL